MSVAVDVFGLGVRVNVDLGGLRGLPRASRIDVTITVGELPPGCSAWPEDDAVEYHVSPFLDDDGRPGMRASRWQASGFHQIAYSDGTNVFVSDDGARVWALSPEGSSVEDTATYLLGPVLGLVLRLRGSLALHASAVAIDGRAVAFVGPSGAGKSSLAAAFAKLGYPILTDDLVALGEVDSGFEVQPAYRRVRLWRESAEALFVERLPLLTPNWDKRFLDLDDDAYAFQSRKLHLGAVFVLAARSTAGPVVESIAAREALMSLVPHSYVGYLLDSRRRAREFEELARLVRRVQVFRLTPHVDIARIDECCRSIAARIEG